MLARILNGLDALRGRRSKGDHVDEIARLTEEVNRIKELLLIGRQVDLVDFGELRVFMYTDDLGYKQLGGRYKGFTPSPSSRDWAQPRREPQARYDNTCEPLVSFLLSHYWVHSLDFAYFDIGCQYGTSAMATAQVILSSGNANHVYAFDPGMAGNLAATNILLNKLQDIVTFERLGVSYDVYPGLVFIDSGHSENNRLVNRGHDLTTLSYVAMCTSLDRYAEEKGISTNAIVKIDTQGGEPEVLKGMRRMMETYSTTMLMEFAPHALQTRVQPIEWLAQLSNEYALYEIRDIDIFLSPAHHVNPIRELGQFVAELTMRSEPYTDLLCLPKKLPGLDSLQARLKRT